MKTWLVIAMVVAVVAIAGFAFVNAVSSDNPEQVQKTCGATCGNSCSAESNCGLATCGATQGKTCSCGK